MSYLVLARKYRPQTFDELVGQEFVSTALKNAITLNRVSHSYLFTGARGVGKTSAARILAKALNCLNPVNSNPCNECEHCHEITNGTSMDVLEIDGASNRGIDEIRQLREAVKFIPVKYKYKVYIVDEVHMLTGDASNALLKTLEEPPSYVVFIFATTDVHKMLPTILSRCQRYDFRKIPFQEMHEALQKIYNAENIKYDHDSLNLVVRQSEGCMRDALSFSDQIISYTSGDVTYDAVAAMLGVSGDVVVGELYKAVLSEDKSNLDSYISKLSDRGVSLLHATETMITYTRNLLLLKNGAEELKKELTADEQDYFNTLLQASEARLFAVFQLLQKLHNELKYSSFVRYAFEFGMYKAASLSKIIPLPVDSTTSTEKKTEFLSSSENNTFKIPEKKNDPVQVKNFEQKSTLKSVMEAETIKKGHSESFDSNEKFWHAILTELRSVEAGLASSLFHSRLERVENRFLLYFSKEREFNFKRANSDENRKKLTAFLSSKLNKEIIVEIYFDNKDNKSLAIKKDELESVYEKKIREEFAEQPAIKSFLQTIGASPQDLKVIKNEK